MPPPDPEPPPPPVTAGPGQVLVNSPAQLNVTLPGDKTYTLQPGLQAVPAAVADNPIVARLRAATLALNEGR